MNDASSGIAVGLETSQRAGSVALWAGGVVHARSLARESAHASDLLPALDALRATAGLGAAGLRTCELVCVGVGPGSYTGLRVGLATAIGLARGTGAALRAVPSVEALAFGGLEPGETATVVLDVRAGRYACARYTRSATDVDVLSAPHAVPAEELAQVWNATDVIFVDERTRALLANTDHEEHIRGDVTARAEHVLELGRARFATHGATPQDALEPLYLMEFTPRTRARRP